MRHAWVGWLAAALTAGAAGAADDRVPLAGGGETPRLWLRGERLSAAFLPELGGKIVSLRTADGWEALSRSGRPYARRGAGSEFGASEFDGVDELFPTMGACKLPPGDAWDGAALPGHGLLWRQAWRHLPGEPGVTLEAGGETDPYRFRRTATIEGDALRLDYVVTNRTDLPLPFLYTFHPLLRGSAGLRYELPDAMEVTASWSSGQWLGRRGERRRWDTIRDAADAPFADAVFVPGSGRYYKFFSPPLSNGRFALRHADGTRVSLAWPAETLPHVAVWCSEGGVAGLHHVAPEPTRSVHEALDEALAAGGADRLAPRGARRWTIYLRVESRTTSSGGTSQE